MITITQNKGFQLTFENGLTISVQIGTGNYCERRDQLSKYKSEMTDDVIQSQNAEIAIWDQDRVWFSFENDTVLGWVKTEEVGEWIEKVRKAKDLGSL